MSINKQNVPTFQFGFGYVGKMKKKTVIDLCTIFQWNLLNRFNQTQSGDCK